MAQRVDRVVAAEFEAVAAASDALRNARATLRRELERELERKLENLRANQAHAVRVLHERIIAETGRPNYAAIKRAVGTQDHRTVQGILARTESVAEEIVASVTHPDDARISKDADGRYTWITDAGEARTFRIARGEFVGISADYFDELHDENAIERIQAWEERRGE